MLAFSPFLEATLARVYENEKVKFAGAPPMTIWVRPEIYKMLRKELERVTGLKASDKFAEVTFRGAVVEIQ